MFKIESMQLIQKYFGHLSATQQQQFAHLFELYQAWNQKINVVSRKDIDELYLRHVLHSLGIAKVIEFAPQSQILDVGTGGGFPGIPLAIMFPECQFDLIDIIGKKIKVVRAIADDLQLKNLNASQNRAQNITQPYDFVVSRAVTNMDDFVGWVNQCISKKQKNTLQNGILYLKGGDLTQELQNFPKARLYPLKDYFEEDFFDTKLVVHLPLKY